MDSPHNESEALRAGGSLGPYELVAPIGVGGMARVWAARVRGKQDIVALKMLLPELAENVEFRKMFFDEARIASRVRHPNVCSTFEMGEQSGILYLAMEWLDGPSLMHVLRPGRSDDTTEAVRIPIRPRIAAHIVADACAGLHAAHQLVGEDGRSLGVVHRDVSPHNLLMTSTGEVKVTDFGVAKALGKSHMTIAGQLKGKLAYMAPEQLTGAGVDRRCDVFALGCVLYEITTGQRPFKGDHDPQVMASIMLGRYEPPGALIAGYPHELSIIVMRALANDPENRYASAEQMRAALETYLRNSGPAVGPVQIAALIRERCGAEMDARANAVRNEAHAPMRADMRDARTTGPRQASQAAASAHDSGSGAMMVVDGRPAQPRGVLWLATAALVGAALGVGVLSYVRTARRTRSAVAAAEASSKAAAASASATYATAGLHTGPNAATATSAPAVVHGPVHLRITPASAVVVVDGVIVPRGTDTVARPTDGTTMNVLVRADKFQDTIVMVDSATPDEVEVTLDPIVRPVSLAGTRDGGGRAAKDSGATSPLLEAPPNPYE